MTSMKIYLPKSLTDFVDEQALAHMPRNKVRASYNRAAHLLLRRKNHADNGWLS